MSDRDDAPELVDVHRFTNAWEKTASLALRHGRTEVLDTYLDHRRIHEGDGEVMTDVEVDRTSRRSRSDPHGAVGLRNLPA